MTSFETVNALFGHASCLRALKENHCDYLDRSNFLEYQSVFP